MTLKEFIPIVEKLKMFYRQDNFIPDKRTSDSWYEMLKDLEAPATMKAVENYIKSNRFPPTVADIRSEYARMYEAYQSFIREVKKEYGIACQYYPHMDLETENETFNVFMGKLKKHPQGEWITRTKKYCTDTINYIKDCELNHREIPKYRDYINEQTI